MKHFLLLTLLALSVCAQTIRHNEVGQTNLEATSKTIFPYNGGTGTYNVTVGSSAAYNVTSVGVKLTSVTSDVNAGGMTVKVNYEVAPTTVPISASVTVSIAGFAPQTLPITIAGQGSVTSAASYSIGKIAHGGLATFWASGMGAPTNAQLPLPTTLANTTIYREQFGTNTRIPCPLLYVSPTQVNFQMNSSQNGLYVIYSENASGEMYSTFVNVGPVAPDIFSINSTGTDYAAITIQRNDNGTVYEAPILQWVNNRWVPDPIKLTSQTYLLFYATGARNEINLTASYAILDGKTILPLTYAGPQGQYVGLDQIAVQVPTNTQGTHTIQFNLNGWWSNTTIIVF